jgi:hypothetical protein
LGRKRSGKKGKGTEHQQEAQMIPHGPHPSRLEHWANFNCARVV